MFRVGTKGGLYGAGLALSYTGIDLTYGPQNGVPGIISLNRDLVQLGRNTLEHLKSNRIENPRALSEAATLYRKSPVDFMHRVFGIPNINLD